ncbi:MAG: IS1182 family transposase [Elusimicrobia bacterium]|nr:IS1182 family transposase [Elusimicrobiota bacterium]
MAYNFKSVDRETAYLLPPSMREWLPAKHLAWFVVDAVEGLDLANFYSAYRSDGWGRAAYEPGMMTALLMYAYCLGERSSREIEKACEVDVAFRVVSGNGRPDHSTICRFRREHENALKGLFLEVLRLCRESGLVKAGAIALDGTKMKANAALSANRDYEHLKKEVDRLFEEAKAKDEEEDKLYGKDRRGDELPDECATKEGRLKLLREAKARLEAEAAAEAAEQAAKIAQREAEEAATGKKKRGRKPGAPGEKPENEAKANVTDPESRIMKTRSGYVQGYNAQAAVTEDQIIVAAEVTQERNDVGQLLPMLEKVAENLKAVGAPEAMETALADAGYWSEANMSGAKTEGPELLVATNKDWKQRKAMREAPAPRGRIPAAMTARERMERKLLTKRGRALYKLRGQTIEPTFGQIKNGRGMGGFLRRGAKAADSEWALMCATHNLLKLWRSGRVKAGRIWGRFLVGAPIFAPVYA